MKDLRRRFNWSFPLASFILLTTGSIAFYGTIHAQSIPEPRAHHELVFNEADSTVYLIGGSTPKDKGYHYFDEIWEWRTGQWIEVKSLPFPRSSHRVIYHPERNSLILFGGGFARAIRTEGVLWEWKNEEWKAIGGNLQAASTETEMCYDRKRNILVIFGGWDENGDFMGKTWEWKDKKIHLADTTGPSPRSGHLFTYDPNREVCILFGGNGNEGIMADMWEWDGTAWQKIEVSGPAPRWFAASTTNFKTGQIILFGGASENKHLQDTWTWNGDEWSLLTTDGPPPRMGSKLAFTGHSVILFGGRQAVSDGFIDHNDTWELTDTTWEQYNYQR